MSIQEIWSDIYNQISAWDETPSVLTQQEIEAIQKKYERSWAAIQGWTELWLQVFSESLRYSRDQIRHIQAQLWVPRSRQDGIFWPSSFWAYYRYVSQNWNRAVSLWSFLQWWNQSPQRQTQQSHEHYSQELLSRTQSLSAQNWTQSHYSSEQISLIAQQIPWVQQNLQDFVRWIALFQQQSGLKIDWMAWRNTLWALGVSLREDRAEGREPAPRQEAGFQGLSENGLQNAKNWTISRYNQNQINQIAEKIPGRQTSVDDLILWIALFQSQNGLFVDGKAGRNTLRILWLNLNAWNPEVQAQPNTVVRWPDVWNAPETNTMQQEYTQFMNSYVPRRWRNRFAVFASELRNNEVLHPSYPIMLCDSSTRTAICIVWWNSYEVSVYYWHRGFQDDTVHEAWKTPRWVVFHFNDAILPAERLGNSSNTWVDWVIWESLVSPEWARGRWKWFHWIPSNGTATYGCVWCRDIDLMRYLASQIQRSGRWYWYVV